MAKLTKAQFNTLSNEFVKLARDFIDKEFSCSLTFHKESLSFSIFTPIGDCICIFQTFLERHFCVDDFKELVDAAGVALNGQYINMMKEKFYKNVKKSNFINY